MLIFWRRGEGEKGRRGEGEKGRRGEGGEGPAKGRRGEGEKGRRRGSDGVERVIKNAVLRIPESTIQSITKLSTIH